MKKIIIFLLFFPFSVALSQGKVKFYNFDDLLIDGKIKKPQILWVDTKQKVKFEKLLKLKKNLIPKLKDTSKDVSLR